ncbi:MAG: sialidase family protein, partial [Draconibacterium sp.]|nr:sialidase family protein [Draconibacterium sp.]
MKIFLLGIVLLFTVQVTAQDNDFKIAEGITTNVDLFNTSMNPNVSCYRIPAIVTAPNGDLVVAIDERVPSCRDLKWSGDINIVIRRSSDNGKTWSDIEKIVDYPMGKSASDPSMIVDEITGEIFLFYNFMDLDKERDVYYLHVMKSDDNGLTWSKPEDITSQIAKPEWHKDFKFITSGRGIQTSKGKLLHCMVNLDSGMHLFGSDDHGKTWHLIDTPIEPANESKVVELSDGSWMINSRVQGKGMRWVHNSNDEGKTWKSKPAKKLID